MALKKIPNNSRILVVEDENIVAMDIERGLKRVGYEVAATVNNGPEAMAIVKQEDIDLVLMDIRIKGSLDGIQTAEEINKQYHVPIIFLTAYADEDTLSRAKLAGAYGYLVKPFEETELRTAIEVALQKHQAVQKRQKESEQALQQSKNRFKLVIESISDYAIYMLSPDGHIETWNPGAEKITGYKDQEVIGKHFSLLFPQADIEAGKPQYDLKITSSDGRYEEEGWRRRKDGSYFWSNSVTTAIRGLHGELTGFAKIARDLTSRRQSEEAIRQAEERNRLLIDSVKDYALFMLDKNGRVATWNSGAERIKGYKMEEIVGTHFSIFYPEEDRSMGRPEADLKMAEQQGRFEIEGWRIRKDNGRFWANEVITVVYDSQGELKGYSMVIRDITDRKKILDQLHESLQGRDEFLSIASHELKTPLTSLFLHLQMLEKNFKAAESEANQDQAQAQEKQVVSGEKSPGLEGMGSPLMLEKMRKSISISIKQAKKLTGLLNELLDLTRIRLGKIPLSKQDVNLSETVKAVIEREIQGTPAERLVKLRLASGIIGHWDLERVEQIVTNLLSNALKYGEGKPIEISTYFDPNDDESAILEVMDQGQGIDEEMQERIFERFERAVGGSSNISGLGLGLYIVKQIVLAHGGTVSVESKIGEGTQFFVQLPALPRRYSFHSDYNYQNQNQNQNQNSGFYRNGDKNNKSGHYRESRK